MDVRVIRKEGKYYCEYKRHEQWYYFWYSHIYKKTFDTLDEAVSYLNSIDKKELVVYTTSIDRGEEEDEHIKKEII